MKFQVQIANNFKLRIPASVAEHMNLKPGDLVDVSIEHHIYTRIAESKKFTDFCIKLGRELNKYHAEYQDDGGKAKQGSFKVWLVKKLNLASEGLKYWTGTDSLQECFPGGKLPPAKFEITDMREKPTNNGENTSGDDDE